MLTTVLILFLVLYLLMMWLFAYGLRRRDQRVPASGMPGQELPGITVVVSARNEAATLPRLLEALSCQWHSGANWEVVVVDDYSNDGTYGVCMAFPAPFPLRVIRLADGGTPPGKKHAITAGVKEAYREVILVTDADSVPAKGWVASFQEAFADPGCHFAAGLVRFSGVIGGVPSIGALDFYGLVGSSAGAALLGLPFMCNAASMAFRKDGFLLSGGMAKHAHLSSGDDVMLLHDVITTHGSCSVAWLTHPTSWVNTTPPPTFAAFFRQRVRWASKSKAYKNPVAISAALVVLIANGSMVAGTMLPFTGTAPFWIIPLLYVLKMAADLPLLAGITRHFEQQRAMRWFIPASILYPWYTFAAGVLSWLWKPSWKGRRIR
jgi:cellulose synthase/poly-beta-1,6-N-acetylglucosamine synthase-like glycosyltransferase